MISVENLTKSFGDHILFDEASFKINARERVGLLGRNGHGKTTLFRILVGEETYDAGRITQPKNYRIGYVTQQLAFTQATVLAEGMTGLAPAECDHHWKVEKILAGLGFSEQDFQRPPGEFSGGFQVRLNLAKVIVSEPDMLLLDEPTNYLDIASIRWIRKFLLNWPHELLLITHDRSFMDSVVSHTLGIHRQKFRKIAGPTEKYYNQVAQDEEIYEKTRMNDERRRREINQFITRFRAKARLANLVQSRIKTLAKLEKKDKLERLKNLDFSFRERPFRAKRILDVRNLTYGYDPRKPLIKKFDLTVNAGERICVVGRNGKGKTTLLKLLAGVLLPQQGDIHYHPAAERGFFEQTNIADLVDTRTVEEEILLAGADIDRQLARNICGAMLFEQDDALKKISVLSGGEKSRVMLGKLLVTPLNLLLLDEPTNHLDMESCDALLAAIDCFEGTVIMVTHNEMFLNALADRLVVFQDDTLVVHEGGYQHFLEKEGWHGETIAGPERSTVAEEEPARTRITKKETRRRRSAIITAKTKALKPIENSIAEAEEIIAQHEKLLAEHNQTLVEASRLKDGVRIGELSRAMHQCQQMIEKRFEELEKLYQSLAEQSAHFQAQLDQLEDEEL
jgi:ATP-binding cassette subfamily F protein 3